MADTYTTRNRLTKQEPGTHTNTWGLILNALFDQVDFSLDGVVTISASGTTTLSTANGTTDQARGRILNVTATSAVDIVIPSLEKWYLVRAATVDVRVGISGGNQATVKAGDIALVFCDSTTTRKVQSNDFGGQKLRNIADGTADQDAVSYKQLIEAVFSSMAGDYPGLPGNKRRHLTVSDAEATILWAWANLKPMTVVTLPYTAAHQDRLSVSTAAGALTLTLPLNPSEGDLVFFKDGNAIPGENGFAENNLTIARNGQTIGGGTDDLIVRRRGAAGFLEFMNADWEVTVVG